MDCNYTCLVCEAFLHTNKHRCIPECTVAGDRVYHFDFCKKCQHLMLLTFIRQMSKIRIKED